MQVPLFPLHAVLYPEGPLPLRIFEARYVDMVGDCLKRDCPFGVLLIRQGSETGSASTYEIGTLARIVDWYQGSDGLLGITVLGTRRFRLQTAWRREDGLNVGDVETLSGTPPVALPAEYRPMVQILEGVLDSLGRLYGSLDRRYEDAGWVAWRFAEILPLPPAEKQACLEIDEPLEHLRRVRRRVREMRGVDIM